MGDYFTETTRMIALGMRNVDISKALGCSQANVSQIRRGFTKGANTESSSIFRFKEGLEAEVQHLNGCWLLTTSIGSKGYAHRSFRGKGIMAHRASYLAYKGEIPKGMQVCHTCDVRNCVNPDHLFLGTQQDNEDDKKYKGRTPKGEGHYSAVLTAELVQRLRKDYTTGDSWMALEKQYGINRGVIRCAILGITWKHIA